MNADETAFEDAIEASLLGPGGYQKSERQHFDAGLGLDQRGLQVGAGGVDRNHRAWPGDALAGVGRRIVVAAGREQQ